MKIKILKDNNTATDPRTIVFFKKDEVVEIKQDLASDLIKYGLAIEIKEEKMLPKFENKAIFSSPENKEEEIILKTEIVKEIEVSDLVEKEAEEAPENKEEETKINNKKKGKK
jgi:hypothetical protein